MLAQDVQLSQQQMNGRCGVYTPIGGFSTVEHVTVSEPESFVTGYEKRAHFAHVDDFPFVILRCSTFNVLPVAVCFVLLASIVSELRSIELSSTEFRYFKIQAVKHSLPVNKVNSAYQPCYI